MEGLLHSVLTRSHLWHFALACNKAKVKFVVLRGAACIALGGPQIIRQLDVVFDSAPPGQPGSVKEIVKALKIADPESFALTVFTPYATTLTFMGIEVNILDGIPWHVAHRFKKYLLPDCHVTLNFQNQHIKVPLPYYLLREAFIDLTSYRRGEDFQNELKDIIFLLNFCKDRDLPLSLTKNLEVDEPAIDGYDLFRRYMPIHTNLLHQVVRFREIT